jgi:hypothetical protein
MTMLDDLVRGAKARFTISLHSGWMPASIMESASLATFTIKVAGGPVKGIEIGEGLSSSGVIKEISSHGSFESPK